MMFCPIVKLKIARMPCIVQVQPLLEPQATIFLITVFKSVNYYLVFSATSNWFVFIIMRPGTMQCIS